MAGWWLDLESGELIGVVEHRWYVVDEPERFRLLREERRKLRRMSRVVVLKLAFSHGFLRIREDGPEVHFEFQWESDVALTLSRSSSNCSDPTAPSRGWSFRIIKSGGRWQSSWMTSGLSHERRSVGNHGPATIGEGQSNECNRKAI